MSRSDDVEPIPEDDSSKILALQLARAEGELTRPARDRQGQQKEVAGDGKPDFNPVRHGGGAIPRGAGLRRGFDGAAAHRCVGGRQQPAGELDQRADPGDANCSSRNRPGLSCASWTNWLGRRSPLRPHIPCQGGTYTAASPSAPTYAAGTILQFADNTTPINVPNGTSRALKLALAIELGPQYDTDPSAALVKQAAEARAAAFPVPNRPPIPGTSGQAVVPLAGGIVHAIHAHPARDAGHCAISGACDPARPLQRMRSTICWSLQINA